MNRNLTILGTILTLALLPLGHAGAQQSASGEMTSSIGAAGPHRVWLTDAFLWTRSALMDGDTGDQFGVLSGGAKFGHIVPVFSHDGDEIYLPQTHFSRTWRGERTDFVAVYDGRTFGDRAEIVVPSKIAHYPPHGAGSVALSDEGRFLAVFNLTPATSLSIVDVRARSFVREIDTPGCSLVFPAGERRFAMVCGDGSVLVVALSEDGSEETFLRTAPFFDPEADPITEKAALFRDSVVFVSYEGFVHQVHVEGAQPAADEPWSLVTDDEREDGWRVGGVRHLAVHESSGSLYALMHQGEADSHKDDGTEVWVYDLESKERVRRIEVRNANLNNLRQSLQVESGGFYRSALDFLLTRLAPNYGASMIGVSQDAEPVLFVVGVALPPVISVHDALTGEHLRDLSEAGLIVSWLEVP